MNEKIWQHRFVEGSDEFVCRCGEEKSRHSDIIERFEMLILVHYTPGPQLLEEAIDEIKYLRARIAELEEPENEDLRRQFLNDALGQFPQAERPWRDHDYPL